MVSYFTQEETTWKTPTKTAGTIVMENKEHVLGVDREACAVL